MKSDWLGIVLFDFFESELVFFWIVCSFSIIYPCNVINATIFIYSPNYYQSHIRYFNMYFSIYY